jgi:hypothetical protein
MNEKSYSPSKEIKRGWWSRFLDRLIKANKESLQQGCRA